MAVTIKQIAQHAGLSVPTVSRILNNDAELFRVETREKVLKAALDLGYRPNSYRMALRTKKFNAIGLLFPADASESLLSCHTQCALLQELQRRNQHLVAGQAGTRHVDANSNGDGDEVAKFPKMLREWSVDGLLIDSLAAAPQRLQEWIARTRIPAIWLDVKRPVDCVYADEFNGVKEGTERLLKLGHRRIMYLDCVHRDPCGHRQAGYSTAMKSAGLSPHVFVPEDVERSRLADHFSEWLRGQRGPNFPTAIFCDDSELALPLYIAAIRGGISVPKDLSILTIHDEICVGLGLALSTMRLPSAEMAVQGLAALDEKIANPLADVPPRALQLVYEEGTSVGPLTSPAPNHPPVRKASGS